MVSLCFAYVFLTPPPVNIKRLHIKHPNIIKGFFWPPRRADFGPGLYILNTPNIIKGPANAGILP